MGAGRDPELREWIARRFRIPAGGPSKVTTLRDAVAGGVRPGHVVHFGMTHTRFSAAAWELLRQFRGTDPGFTFASVQMSTPFAPLVHAGLARQIISSWSGDSYYTPGPNPVYQRAWTSGVEFRHWSILTVAQRLSAGARGLKWTTTRSLAGSSMETDNADDVRHMDDGSLAIRALVPDVSIVHAPAADASGNVLASPPLMDGLSGALAARRGAIVTVERVVDESFVRQHAHLTRIPSSAVRAVVEAPLGGHPGGLLPTGIEGIDAYGEDIDFWADIRRASRDAGALDAWIEEWVLGCDTHDKYLARLGGERIDALKRYATTASAERDLDAALEGLSLDGAATALETAIVVAARTLGSRARAIRATSMLAGAGMANLAAWLAAYDLADDGIRLDLVAEMGLVGYWPRPGDPLLFNQRNFPTCTMLADIDTTLSLVIGGAHARSLGSLGAAQVDRFGNINSTLIPGEGLLMGSGGANDVATCATETVVTVAQSRERMVADVPYVTAPGSRVTAVVSTLGVYEKDQGELVLTGVFGDDATAIARECRERCGWELRVARDLATVPPPDSGELRTLRVLDPKGWFRT